MVYKLVAVADSPDGELRPVAKKSAAKTSTGGRKAVHRAYEDGVLVAETFSLGEPGPDSVQVALVRKGEVVHTPSLDEVRAHAASALASLPRDALGVSHGPPYLTATPETHTATDTGEPT
jgi:nicotinate phosphoribosyltransferase